MLFNSYIFIFLFLPITVSIFYWLRKRYGTQSGVKFLIVASLFFYGWWNPIYLTLIIASVIINYYFGIRISSHRIANQTRAKTLLFTGISLNLSAIAFFKYSLFITGNLNFLFGLELGLGQILLPLAISFFTFQQIAYLVDCYETEDCETNFANYALFVTFFPQLIAGPIVHHKEMLPQFLDKALAKIDLRMICVGLTIFSIGLFKKTVLADKAALYATPVFRAAETGDAITFIPAWTGALFYTMQLYFDFSGYCDMAIGAALLFGISLPLNFNSPYKALNIIDFWRRWHMTLSRFLREYLYIRLGGNRNGKLRRHVNLLTTMLIGGLWHGAGWTFVAWGGLHGLYLIVNHAWQSSVSKRRPKLAASTSYKFLSWVITFLCVVIAWVYFRAESFSGANSILSGMFGVNGIVMPKSYVSIFGFLSDFGVQFQGGGGTQLLVSGSFMLLLLAIAVGAPNSHEIVGFYGASRDSSAATEAPLAISQHDQGKTPILTRWRISPFWATTTGIIAALGIASLTSVSEFLYFQF